MRVGVRVRDGGRGDGAQVQVGQRHGRCAHVPSREKVTVHLVRVRAVAVHLFGICA